MKNKKAPGISADTIRVATIVFIVLMVLTAIFMGRLGTTEEIDLNEPTIINCTTFKNLNTSKNPDSRDSFKILCAIAENVPLQEYNICMHLSNNISIGSCE